MTMKMKDLNSDVQVVAATLLANLMIERMDWENKEEREERANQFATIVRSSFEELFKYQKGLSSNPSSESVLK